jgi:hypothetical protein
MRLSLRANTTASVFWMLTCSTAFPFAASLFATLWPLRSAAIELKIAAAPSEQMYLLAVTLTPRNPRS